MRVSVTNDGKLNVECDTLELASLHKAARLRATGGNMNGVRKAIKASVRSFCLGGCRYPKRSKRK